MLSLLTNTKPIKTTLIFPDDQKLWTFFAMAKLSRFRIESSKNKISGRFHRDDIELAKQRFCADALKEKLCLS